MTAVGPKVGGRRGPAPETVIGRGASEIEALAQLVEALEG